LPPIQDHFDDVGCKERKAQYIAHIARIDFLLCGDLFDRAVSAAIEKLPPSKPASKRFHKNVVDVKSGRDCRHGGAVWRNDELAPAAPTKCHGNVHGEGVFTHYAAAF
jgi:hypothetical protein